jgi:hypothetical protein
VLQSSGGHAYRPSSDAEPSKKRSFRLQTSKANEGSKRLKVMGLSALSCMRPFGIVLFIYAVVWTFTIYGLVNARNMSSAVVVFFIGLLGFFFLFWLREKL